LGIDATFAYPWGLLAVRQITGARELSRVLTPEVPAPPFTKVTVLSRFFSTAALLGALFLGASGAQASFRIERMPAGSSAEQAFESQDATDEVIRRALSVLGTPYRWGGSSPKRGFDCSGLVNYAFRDVDDLDLPRTSRALARVDSPRVSRDDLQPGDLLFFRIRGRQIDHVAIYLGNDRFIHAPRRGAKVRIEQLSTGYWQRRFQLARRVMPDAPTVIAHR